MDEYTKEALKLVYAQATVRPMQEEEMLHMVRMLAEGLRHLCMPQGQDADAEESIFPQKAIKERSIICLECGKSFKMLTKKHLQSHHITPEDYREKYGYKKGMPLVCKSLQRDRRKKMHDLRLWEHKKNAPVAAGTPDGLVAPHTSDDEQSRN